MTAAAESEKCGITSLFIMSCRGRAEAFARHLQSRLSSLNNEKSSPEPNETTWLASTNKIALVQPKHEESYDCSSSIDSCQDCLCENSDIDITVTSVGIHRVENSLELSDEELIMTDGSISSNDYGTCLEDLSRTLTDDSFISIEGDEGVDKVEDDTRNEDEYLTVEENKKNEENNISNGDERLCGCEVIEEINNKTCDILKITDENSSLKVPDDAIIQKLNLLNAETTSIKPEDQEEEIAPLRRCSSLRTGKTPPGTPGRKKIVRFADVLGLDLADVRTFLDEIPRIPNSAYVDLPHANLTTFTYREGPEKILIPMFTQPGGLLDFLERVRTNKVCLENALVEDLAVMSIKGTVRVLNLDFQKTVHVRYSTDGWKSFSDLQCSYVTNSCDGFSDKFTFLVYANTLKVGERLEFAIRYQCKNSSYWDNNFRCNYAFQCLPSTSSMPYSTLSTEEPWGTAFYYNESDGAIDVEERHHHLAIQEYIAATLDKHQRIDAAYFDAKRRPNFVTVFLVVIVSIVFLYIQRAVYFT